MPVSAAWDATSLPIPRARLSAPCILDSSDSRSARRPFTSPDKDCKFCSVGLKLVGMSDLKRCIPNCWVPMSVPNCLKAPSLAIVRGANAPLSASYPPSCVVRKSSIRPSSSVRLVPRSVSSDCADPRRDWSVGNTPSPLGSPYN